MSNAPITIAVEALSIHAGTHRLLGPISFQLPAAQVLVIMGETGAGKSLLAQAILGTLPAGLCAEGIIHFNGRRIDQLSLQERAKQWGREVAILPQEPWRALDPLMAASTQVQESHRYVARLSRQKAVQATRRDFDTLDLRGSEKCLPGSLSGGMAQRVAFAAATAANAQVLIADEPTKGLDTERSAKVVSLLAEVPRQGGTLLAITHEISVAKRLGGNLLVLKSGNLVEQGSTKSVLSQPSAAYTQELLDAEPQAWSKLPSVENGAVLLEAKNLSICRNERLLVQQFNLRLHAGERIAITGPSGVGKTSLLDALAGLISPASGKIERAEIVSKSGIQKLYQDPPAAFPARVPLGKSLRDVAQLHRVEWSVVTGYLSQLGIQHAMLDRLPDAVSGGELQRISIARALTTNPFILLADEPTSRLDPITQRETLNMMANIARDQKIAIVLVTHDEDIAAKWADKCIALAPLTRD